MRCVHFWAVLLCVAGLGCESGWDIDLVGERADGLTVECTPDGDEEYQCDPQPPGDDGGDGAGGAGGSAGGDDCSSWAAGGPMIALWPPNHKMHTVTLDECAEARATCDVAAAAAIAGGRILAVTSDEPLEVGAGGDGMTPEDDLVIVDVGTVALRAERQGGADGRVYRIEIGTARGDTEVCEVHVPHDQGPAPGAVASGEAVRVQAP